MKKLLSIFTFLLLAGSAFAQDSWNLLLHRKVLLTGKKVDEEKNVKLIRASDWKKSGYLEIYFKEDPPSQWTHSIRLADENDAEYWVKDNTLSAKISTATLRKKFNGKKEIRVYMFIAPSDPQSMAPARRIHLATLKLP